MAAGLHSANILTSIVNGSVPPFLVENEAAQSRIYFVGPRLFQKQPRHGLGQVRVLRQVSRREIGGVVHP
jgi:hypothetical protein